jgi:hypothetical protein
MPRTNGSSGPTTTMFISLSKTAFLMVLKSVTAIGKFTAIAAVPEFPGATNKALHNGL